MCVVSYGGYDEYLLWFTFHKTFGFHGGCLPWTEPPLIDLKIFIHG